MRQEHASGRILVSDGPNMSEMRHLMPYLWHGAPRAAARERAQAGGCAIRCTVKAPDPAKRAVACVECTLSPQMCMGCRRFDHRAPPELLRAGRSIDLTAFRVRGEKMSELGTLVGAVIVFFATAGMATLGAGIRRIPWRFGLVLGAGAGLVFTAVWAANEALVDPGTLVFIGAIGGAVTQQAFDRGQRERRRISDQITAGPAHSAV